MGSPASEVALPSSFAARTSSRQTGVVEDSPESIAHGAGSAAPNGTEAITLGPEIAESGPVNFFMLACY